MKSFSLARRGALPRTRITRLALAGFLTAGALTVVPVAQAGSLSAVRSHVHGADAALHQVVSAGAGGSVAAPLAALRAQLRAAGHDSAKLYRRAQTPALRLDAATAMTKLAAQQGRDATALTPLLGQLTGPSQTDLAGFIASVTQGREQALSLVTQLIGLLPAAVQDHVAGVVAALSSAGTGQVGSLVGAISAGSIACPAIDAVSQVVAAVLASVQADLTRVQSLLAFLPTGAAAQLTGILDGLPAELNALVANAKQSLDCSSSPPVAGAASGPTAGVGSVVGSVVGTVGSVVGSVVGTVGSVVGSILQLAQSLLGGLPGLGG